MSDRSCDQFCSPSGLEYSGWQGECHNCGEWRWSNGSDKLYKVPGLIGGDIPIVEVSSFDGSLIQDLEIPRTVRMMWSSSYSRKSSQKKKSHIEHLFGLDEPPNAKLWKNRLNQLNDHVSKFGLKLSPLVPETKVEDSTPLLLHWNSVDPYIHFSGSKQCVEPATVSESGIDPNWSNYQFEMNLLSGWMTGGLKDKQEAAINSILRNRGSLQIIALPTGFGKTRINQITSSILFKNNQGPTLMISPIIALRDDQRESFIEQLEDDNKWQQEYKLNSKFITAVEEDILQIKNELMDGKIGMLCCSPEHILTPSYNTSWMEVFRRMKTPFSTLVIDEAHLVGDWGSSFRSNFLLLGQLMHRMIELNPGLRVVLQSATITKNERKELITLFQGPELLPDISEYDVRKDLHFNVQIVESGNFHSFKSKTIDFDYWTDELTRFYEDAPSLWQQPIDMQNDNGRSPLLIYSAIKKHAEEAILPALRKAGIMENVRSFTGDTNVAEKDTARKQFKENEYDGMVATSAFGMGIDKPDLWTIGYFGLPFTLKGLYQGFGRAARKSNWDMRDKGLPRRNGNCIAIIPDVNLAKSRPWRPELRLGFAAERFWNMFATGSILEEGFIILPILDDLESTEWLQREKDPSDYLSSINLVESDDEELDYTGISFSKDEYEEAVRKMNDGKKKSSTLNLNHRMWSIACLQRSDAVSLLGFYPEVLAINNTTGEQYQLKETLESGGHQAVVDILNNLGHNSGNYIPKNKKRLAVLKVNRPFSSWGSFLRLLKEGHEDLKERHKRGNRELGEFLERVKSKQCLRKSFAPAIGIDFEDAEDCLTSLNSWEQEEMEKMPPVPCKHCLGKLSLGIESDLGFWLENRILEQLGCNESHLNLMFEDYDLGMEIDYGRYVAISLIDDDSIAIFENLAIPANCAPAFVDLEGEPLYHSEYSIDANVVRIGQLDYPRAFAVVCFEKEGLYSFKLVPKNEYSDYGDD